MKERTKAPEEAWCWKNGTSPSLSTTTWQTGRSFSLHVWCRFVSGGWKQHDSADWRNWCANERLGIERRGRERSEGFSPSWLKKRLDGKAEPTNENREFSLHPPSKSSITRMSNNANERITDSAVEKMGENRAASIFVWKSLIIHKLTHTVNVECHPETPKNAKYIF